MKYLEVESCPIRGVLNLIGEEDFKTLNMECSDYVEVSDEEMKDWIPVIKKYQEILRETNKREVHWGRPEKLKEKGDSK